MSSKKDQPSMIPKGKRLKSYNEETLATLENYKMGKFPNPREKETSNRSAEYCYEMENPIVDPMDIRPKTGYWAFRLFWGYTKVYEEGYHPKLGGYSIDFLSKHGICEVKPESLYLKRRSRASSSPEQDALIRAQNNTMSAFESRAFEIKVGIPYLFTI